MTTTPAEAPPFHPILQAAVDQMTKFGLKVVNKWQASYAVKCEHPWIMTDAEKEARSKFSYRCYVSKPGEPGYISINLYDSRAFSFRRGQGERQLIMTPEYKEWTRNAKNAERLSQTPSEWAPTWTLMLEFDQLVVNKDKPHLQEKAEGVKKLTNTDSLYVFGWVVKCLQEEAKLSAHEAAVEMKRVATENRIKNVIEKSGYAPEVVQRQLYVFSKDPGKFYVSKKYGMGEAIFNEEEAAQIIRLMMQAMARQEAPSQEEKSDES